MFFLLLFLQRKERKPDFDICGAVFSSAVYWLDFYRIKGWIFEVICNLEFSSINLNRFFANIKFFFAKIDIFIAVKICSGLCLGKQIRYRLIWFPLHSYFFWRFCVLSRRFCVCFREECVVRNQENGIKSVKTFLSSPKNA